MSANNPYSTSNGKDMNRSTGNNNSSDDCVVIIKKNSLKIFFALVVGILIGYFASARDAMSEDGSMQQGQKLIGAGKIITKKDKQKIVKLKDEEFEDELEEGFEEAMDQEFLKDNSPQTSAQQAEEQAKKEQEEKLKQEQEEQLKLKQQQEEAEQLKLKQQQEAEEQRKKEEEAAKQQQEQTAQTATSPEQAAAAPEPAAAAPEPAAAAPEPAAAAPEPAAAAPEPAAAAPEPAATAPEQAATAPEQAAAAPEPTVGGSTTTTPATNCETVCSRKQQRIGKYGSDDLLDANNLLQLVSKEKEKMVEQLKIDYGEDTYKKIFEDAETGKTRGRSMVIGVSNKDKTTLPFNYNFEPNDDSYTRLRRKIMLKIFQVQQKVTEEKGCGDCATTAGGRQRHLRQQEQQLDRQQQQQHHRVLESEPSPNMNYVKYVWSAAGHSAGAGHGNFHVDQYTKVCARTVHSVFESIGIEFQGRNHAMGGYDSAPEIALCQEAVHGKDIDALSWDYGMTDGRNSWKELLFSERAGKIIQKHERFNFVDGTSDGANTYPQTPTRIDMFTKGNPRYFDRIHGGQELEKNGLAAMYFNEDLWKGTLEPAIPDTFGLTEEQIDAMPKFVKQFKCNGELEKGDPGCQEQKFNNTICEKRRFKVSWHPGWKWHALMGNFFSMFFVETLMDAIEQIVAVGNDVNAKQKLYEDCIAGETADAEKFLQSGLLDLQSKDILKINEEQNEGKLTEDQQNELLNTLYKSPQRFCYTSTLPAEQRYLGYVTGNKEHMEIRQRNEFSMSDYDSYDKGIELKQAKNIPQPKDQASFRLTFEEGFRDGCPQLTHADYKDHFFIQAVEGWTSIVLPTNEQEDYYKVDMSQIKGMIVMCQVKADWGKYWPDELAPADIMDIGKNENGDDLATIEVNGTPVKSFIGLHGCYALKGESNGLYWPKKTIDGMERYEIRVKVNPPKSYLRISSVTIL